MKKYGEKLNAKNSAEAAKRSAEAFKEAMNKARKLY